MTVRRFLKKCEDFSICAETGDAGDYFVEGFPDNYTIFHILLKGKIKLAEPFSDEFIMLNDTLTDTKHYLYRDRLYHALEDCFIVGFNPLNPKTDWDAQLITESFVGNDRSYLICFDGNPTVNGKQMQRWDYTQLSDKEYSVDNDGILVMFTRK